MKPIRFLPLAIVLATICAIGQDVVMHRSPNAVSANPASLNFYPYSMDGCPIGLQVNHGSFFLQRKVEYGPGSNDGIPFTGAVQRIHLIMTNPNPREIVKVQLTVHGYSDKWKAIPLVRASSAPDLAKEVTVVLGIKGNGHASSDLSLNSFTAVTSVDVDSLTYSDGSAWHSTSRGACSVAPSPMMLVSADR
jgi:hypothetical protein